MGFLTDLTRRRRDDLVRQPLDDGMLLTRASARPPARGFESSLRSADGIAVIAEVKRASPSAGPIAEDADPAARALEYAAGGAAAVSVLTEGRHFHGSLTDLEGVRASVRLPVLRKDFLVHPSQVIESRAHGADAVLLITSCCTDDELAAMLATASDLGLGVLLETHSDVDLDRALATDATVVGVNARDLESLEVDVDAALVRLARLARLGPERVAVLESGIATGGDARAAVAAGASAILVGEALMRAADPRALLKDLTMREGAMS
jgi:indole-3-glycerol phosphate synthase